MVKIFPVNSNIIKPNSKIDFQPLKTAINSINHNELIGMTAAVTGMCMLGDSCKHFLQTINDNYFQLKTNPENGKPYEPDVFQKTSANYLFNGDDVIVTAPTGTGKTAIAEYVMTKNLKEGKQTFYTTPLKALSNEKYKDFCNIYGEENVGIITGDVKINTQAPIIIMTTEVYRNMATSAYFNKEKHLPQNLRTVIFDELQYLGDVDRGGVWETSIMLTPSNVQMLSLSATAKNAEEINNWIANIRKQKGIKAYIDGNYHPNKSDKPRCAWVDVPAVNRHVPLDITMEHVLSDGKKAKAVKTKKKNSEDFKKALNDKANLSTYKYFTQKLRGEDKLPAIFFVFSRKDINEILKYFEDYGDCLTTKEEQEQILEIINKYKNEKYLGESLNINAILKGYSAHNAGMLPTQKELIEELFQRKLLKIALATETLSAGINMPAKTTIITSVRKPASSGDQLHDGKRNLSPNEFHQMAGRAGRRGIDTHGFCYPFSCNKAQAAIIEDLMSSPSNNIISNFKFDYAYVANYIAMNDNKEEMLNFISKTFYAQANEYKKNALIKEFNVKRNIINDYGFVSNDNKQLTVKGELLRHLNGYEQIPVINFIADKHLEGLNEAELAGIIAGMANIEHKDSAKLRELFFSMEGDSELLKDKAEELNDEVNKYSDKVSELQPDTNLCVNTNTINHVYKWAKLNYESDDSIKNWKELYTGELKDTIRDEGSLFKEITSTIDLAKQMVGICEVGYQFAQNDDARKYYTDLKEKLYSIIDVMQQTPII